MKLRERKLREWICPSIHPLQLERECPIPWKILHKNLFSFGKNEDGDETKQTKKKKRNEIDRDIQIFGTNKRSKDIT